MKSVISLFLLLIVFHSPLISAEKKCSCGTHATGLTTYHVQTDHEDCCQATPVTGETAIHRTYEQDRNGVWVQIHFEHMLNATAQQDCCP